MATTTRYKIAEQVLRIVNGGNTSDDSSIDIRDVLNLVDQERDSIIKREITDRFYTKSTAQAMGELEITGDFLTKEDVSVTSDSYAVLTNQPISLPNDMGIFRVEAVAPSLTLTERKLTISAGATANSTGTDNETINFSGRPLKLDNQYRISFTVNSIAGALGQVSTETYKFDFTVKTIKSKKTGVGVLMDRSRWNNINIVEAIVDSEEAYNKLKTIGMHVGHSADTGSEDNKLEISGRFDFTVSDFQINGEGSGGAHGFTWTTSHSDGYNASTDATPNTTSLIVTLADGKTYSLHYSENTLANISTDDVAQNFVDKNAHRMAMESNISLTVSGSVLSFKEIIPEGGKTINGIDVSYPGSITGSMESLASYTTDPDYTSNYYEEKIFVRMPSGGPTNVMYHNTAVKSGRRFFYLDGNRIYLYKNTDSIDTITVHYIASSRSLSDTDPYPLPADYEKEIVSSLVQAFGLMKQAVEDITNDNVG